MTISPTMKLVAHKITADKASKDESRKAKSIAQQLFREMESLEAEIKRSKNLTSELENRTLWKKLTTSSSKDLAAIAKNQNSINKRMMDMIQETIRLNMLSFTGLVILMDEMQNGIKHGLTDANGNIIRLGDEGRGLAEAATSIISGILDTSKDTQERIDQNSNSIQHLSHELETKARLDSVQDEAIALLSQKVDEKRKLDSLQSEAISSLEKQAKTKDELDSAQDFAIKNLSLELALQRAQLTTTENARQALQDTFDIRISALEKTQKFLRITIATLLAVSFTWLLTITWFSFLR